MNFCEVCGHTELYPIADTIYERCLQCGHKQRHVPVPPEEQMIRGMSRRDGEGNKFVGEIKK